MKVDAPRKPYWIRTEWTRTPEAKKVRALLREQQLHTVCEESSCPNRGECYNRGVCTFLILGAICTRGCRFCDVVSGRPLPPDLEEPLRVAHSTKTLGVKFVVITSVDRDDLPDFGSSHFAATIEAVHKFAPGVGIEVLTPDFQVNIEAIQRVLNANPDVFAHNVETVERLTPTVRDIRASYRRSLQVLEIASSFASSIQIKSGIMVGIGETDSEVIRTLNDIHAAGADSVTIGQYLAPTVRHLPVNRFVTPGQFDEYAAAAREIGFKQVASGPMVRSSYRAEELVFPKPH